MKLPPMALTAPTLCPRCDAPAIMTDHCVQCALQLRQCGACQGIAGPFDRYCGFCGHELILGERRSAVWRLWLLAALVPLAAGILLGALGLGVPVTRAVGRTVGVIAGTPAPGSVNTLRSRALGFTYSIPKDWTAVDYTLSSDPGRMLPAVIASRISADGNRAADAKGELTDLKPQGTVVSLGRPATEVSLVASDDPKAVLTSQVAPLVATPPAGTKIEVVRPVRSITVSGRPGAEVVLRLTTGAGVTYTERAFIYAPLAGSRGMFRIQAVAPAADWEGGDGERVESIVQSLRFG